MVTRLLKRRTQRGCCVSGSGGVGSGGGSGSGPGIGGVGCGGGSGSGNGLGGWCSVGMCCVSPWGGPDKRPLGLCGLICLDAVPACFRRRATESGASRYSRLKRVSEGLQQGGAGIEHCKDLRFLVWRERQFGPVGVNGDADVVGQWSVAGALKAAREQCDRARRQDDTGDEHFNWLLPPLSGSQTARMSAAGRTTRGPGVRALAEPRLPTGL